MTNVVFKSTSTLMNKITNVTRRNLENLGQTKFAFNANPDRGFIHIFTHRAGQRCFELLALIGSPQLSCNGDTSRCCMDVKMLQHIFTLERGCITPEKLGHKEKTIQFLFTNKQKNGSIYIRKW